MTDTDILKTEEFTVAMCEQDNFSVSTPTMTRDSIKVAVHNHIRETGHQIRFIDACTLSRNV